MPEEVTSGNQSTDQGDIQGPSGENVPAPAYVTKEELAGLETRFSDSIQKSLQNVIAHISSINAHPAPSTSPPPAPASLDEIRDQIARGEPEGLLGAVEAKLQDLRKNGMSEIDSLKTQIGNLVYSSYIQSSPIGQKYGSEIQEVVGNLPPDARTKKEAYEIAEGVIMRRHFGDIVKDAVEVEVRRRLGSDDVATPPVGGVLGRQDGNFRKGKTPEELLGHEAYAIREYNGLSEISGGVKSLDGLARKLSRGKFQTFQEYWEKNEEYDV